MDKIQVVSKGYTLSVTSWENDGDNYRTEEMTVDTKEEAYKIYKICKELFVSRNNKQGGIGNSSDGDYSHIMIEYVKKNPDLFPEFIELLKEDEDEAEDTIVDYFRELAYELMGSSEYYDFRVFERCKITYSPKNIYLEEIKFE